MTLTQACGHPKAEDRENADFYPTPDPLALACCKEARELLYWPEIIVEPSAGSGAFVRAAQAIWPKVHIISVEIRPEANAPLSDLEAGAVYTVDFLEFLEHAGLDKYKSLVIGNPPYSLAQEHIMACLDYLSPGSHIAFLLKLGFLGTKQRANLLWKQGQCKYLCPILGRPSFVKGSCDVNEYGLFIWEVGYDGPMTIKFPHIRWKGTK